KTRLVLAGGRGFASNFGTFYAPNISPDPVAGIGDWSALDLVNAMRFGTSPDGRHYYPAFPYGTFQRASLQDIVSLFGYLQTLPATSTPGRAHEVGFPFSIRAGIGLWKRLYQNEAWILQDVTTPRLARGRYLVEALADCAACHTPRNALGGLINARWLGGAANPTGPGTVPNITPGALDWSALDIMVYLGTGTTPNYDTVGAQMAQVVENLSQLPASDLLAIAAYLKAIPAIK
ncbi:MAG: diacylglycerol kinase, partial [Paracoccaceae bacterium]